MVVNQMRAGLPALPPKMRHLPIDKRGFPVPFFVALVNGEPDHRIADPRKMKCCVEQCLCWICGGQLGVFKAFAIGSMCAVTRTSAEPPAHRECATYAATACPFLTRPHAHRREAGLPEEKVHPGGVMLLRNPGVVCVWVTTRHRPYRAQAGHAGVLFHIGEPDSMTWFCEGRLAMRSEVDASVESGLLLTLDEMTQPSAASELARAVVDFRRLLDAT